MLQTELENLLARYLIRYPDEAVRLAPLTHQLAAESGDPFTRSNMQGHVTASALVLNATRDAFLFIHHRSLGMWLQPGGHYEAPGDLWNTAVREVAEETGVADIVLHEWHHAHPFPFDFDSHGIPARPEKQEGDHVHHDGLYLAVAPGEAEVTPQLAEVSSVRWVPFAELPALPGLRLARLLPKLKSAGIIP